MKNYAELIRDNNDQINGETLQNIIKAHDREHERMWRLYERYKATPEGVTIFNRKHPDFSDFERLRNSNNMMRIDDKVNNTLNNSFDSDIADTAQGYFLGHPIMYAYEEDESISDMIDTFNTRNHVEDADSEWGKKAIICGKGARLLYIDREGRERLKNIDPWQCIFIGDNISEPEYAIRYYKGIDHTKKAEFYNSTTIHYFAEENGEYKEKGSQPHMFDSPPLFGLANNNELQGDAEKVLTLIDAYDRTLSDASNEIEQYRLAYMVFKGMAPDEDTNEQMRHQRIIELMEENDDVSYLTKDVNDDLIEHHLDRLETNIMKFAKSVDFSDDDFGNAASGVSLRYKLLALENKCVTKERKMTMALRYQYKVLFSAWAKRNNIQPDDYLNVRMTFQRNLPVNLLEEAQIQQALQGVFSRKYRLSLFSKMTPEEIEEEMQRLQEEENAEGLSLDDVSDEVTPPDEDEDEFSSDVPENEKTRTCPRCSGSGCIKGERKTQILCPRCDGEGVIA
ncbi:phage portal protein [Salimicrobium album]|uniref:Phage portal protein, SPP1 family n=1 Tax=Salimicrobium album TaxID=50717 RepID=A0A1H3D7K5_9BACI|nr:phage portal protein [Salimicrobium album]SDX62443.1 phage portal protein, SPP1 family [Salimicrobium album]